MTQCQCTSVLSANASGAADGKCHDCKSPARICRALVVHMGAPKGFEKCEIVLVGESLGY